MLLSPAIESPLTETIVSPTSIPAPSAGEPRKTWTARRPRLTGTTEMPTPEKRPSIAWLKLSRLSGEKYSVKRSPWRWRSPLTMPCSEELLSSVPPTGR